MFPVTTALLLIISLMIFAHSLYQRIALLTTARGQDARNDQIWKRIRGVITFAFGQKKLFKYDGLSGLAHAFIFWGFCVIALRTLYLFALGFCADLPFFGAGTWFGFFYDLTLNVFIVLVIMACGFALYRRLVARPARLTLSNEANLILILIITLCVSDTVFEAAAYAQGQDVSAAAFLSYGIGQLMTTLSLKQLQIIEGFSFLIHITLILVFLNALPFTKHFHIITAIPNVFFRNLKPAGELSVLDLADEAAQTFGVNQWEQFSWKNYLNWYSCTECGRCSAQCPAVKAEKVLDPKKVTMRLRNACSVIARHNVPKQSREGILEGLDRHDPQSGSRDDDARIIGNTVLPDELWACTTCRACEEACPVMIEHVPQILDMRRHLVLMQGAFPPELKSVFQNLERHGNPWGISFEERGAWAKGLDVPLLVDKPDAEYLYFVGCAASYDEKAKKIAQAFVKILNKANISFAILGAEEKCTGDSARRLGNEYLAQQLIQENVATLNRYGVKKIITTCPHCYNAIKNDFAQFGGHFEVWHHTEFLQMLVQKRQLQLTASPIPSLESITYHDPCYLARYFSISDAPRELLRSMTGTVLTEPEQNREMTQCCGAGGGRMWMEDEVGKRMNHQRLGDLKNTGANVIATACPFCKTMLTDALDETETESIDVKDIIEILAESMEGV